MAPQDVIYQQVFRALPSPMALLTSDFVVLDVNDAGLEAAGRPLADLQGRNWFEVFPPVQRELGDDAGPFWTSLNDVLASGEHDVVRMMRYDLETSDSPGEPAERYWTAVNSPIRDDNGSIAMIACRVEDVTYVVMQSRAQQARH